MQNLNFMLNNREKLDKHCINKVNKVRKFVMKFFFDRNMIEWMMKTNCHRFSFSGLQNKKTRKRSRKNWWWIRLVTKNDFTNLGCQLSSFWFDVNFFFTSTKYSETLGSRFTKTLMKISKQKNVTTIIMMIMITVKVIIINFISFSVT